MGPVAPWLLLAVLSAGGPADAAGPPPESRPSLSVSGMAGQGFHEEGQGFAEFGALSLRLSREASRRLELALEIYPLLLVRQPRLPPYGPRETVEAFAADLGLRWFPGPRSGVVSPYLEVLEGPFYSLRRVPATGSTFNFLTQLSVGVVVFREREFAPVVGYRWVHVSNAGLGRHNPDWDFHALVVGARLPLRTSR